MRAILIITAILALAQPAQAQLGFRKQEAGPPADLPPLAAEAWPYPAPDPKSWWDDKRPKASEAADPLGGRRLGRNQRLPQPDNRIDASTYRLWGLMPLQWQLLKSNEMVLEVWVRPAGSVRQSIMRVTVRDDGKAFVNGRAGLACCEALIGRRMGFDAELPAGSAQTFLALRGHPMWREPRDVRVDEGGGASEGVCVDGASYDVTLLTPEGSKALRRACDGAQVGQVADAVEPALRAALGHDPRFDVLYPGGADFNAARRDYSDLLARGGRLLPETRGAPPPGEEPAPQMEDVPPPAQSSNPNP